jgi:hypothetical protein
VIERKVTCRSAVVDLNRRSILRGVCIALLDIL